MGWHAVKNSFSNLLLSGNLNTFFLKSCWQCNSVNNKGKYILGTTFNLNEPISFVYFWMTLDKLFNQNNSKPETPQKSEKNPHLFYIQKKNNTRSNQMQK